MTGAGTNPRVATEVPWAEEITDYDKAHLALYLRLLEASAAGVHMAEMARLILRIDPIHEPESAQTAVSSHLRRARWMTEHGDRDLLRP